MEMKPLNTHSPRGNAAVDDILDELRSNGKPAAKVDDSTLDSILAELGIGDAPVAAKPAAPPRPAPAAKAPDAPPEPQQKPAPAPRGELFAEAEPAPAPAPKAQPKSQTTVFAPPAAAPKKKGAGGETSIWDVELNHERDPGPPRVGKAAALDRVQQDKYVGDEELASWFSGDAPMSRREQRRAEKEAKRQEAAERKEEKRRRKAGYDNEDEYEADELAGPVSDEEELAYQTGDVAEYKAPAAPEAELLVFEDDGVEEESAPPPSAEVEAIQKAIGGEEKVDTLTFEIEEGGETRVPTATFTQEFEAGEEPEAAPKAPEGTKNLFLDDMVDDRFREFFSETVIVDRQELEAEKAARGKRRSKKTRSALLTGEFGKLAEQAELAEQDAAEEEMEDYNRPQDAEAIEGDLQSLKRTLTRRTIITGVLAALLFWVGFAYKGSLAVPAFMSPAAQPVVFAIVYLVLVLAAIGVNFTTLAAGLVGLAGEPTVDSAPALASVGALLQGVVVLVQAFTAQPAALATQTTAVTLFGGVAALLLAFNALGKRVRAVSILGNFKLASSGFDHSAAYILDNSHELAYNITKGLEEEDPMLLVSRPTALVKGFLRQSFSQRWSDRMGRITGWVLLAVSVLAAGVSYFLTQDLMATITTFAAVLCIGAPLSSTLVSAVPSAILQKSTARVGAVVPGWSAIEELGEVNVVMAGARDIFPPTAVRLQGIKTFEKERVDLAILYAASVLIEGCDTMRDIFLGVIQGKNDMLYKVESLAADPGRGFTAWVENNRIVIGSREMLQKHDIDPPSMEIEMKYVKEGCMPVYLAVAGRLFAMFIVGYGADPEVQDTLDGLVKSGVSLLVTSEDMNVTAELIETAYSLPKGVVKVLGRREREMLEPLTAYLPESDGVMTHIGTFSSFIGGMRAAAGCAASERMSGIVQLSSVVLAMVLCVMLVVGGGLSTLSVTIAVLYHLAWTVLVSALPFARRY